LSREVSAARGREFRAFNFSMGGADLTSYPLVYRFARLVARPREIWIVTPASSSPAGPESLEVKLLGGPAGRALRFPALLPVELRVYDLPIVRHAAAMRDWFVHRWFANRPASNLDLYEINRHGDTRSLLYNPPDYKRGDEHVTRHVGHVIRLQDRPEEYFLPRVLAALQDLRSLAAEDGVAIKVVAFDTAVSLAVRDPQFLEATRKYFEPLAGYLGGSLIDVRTRFDSLPYMHSDSVHLNSHGADQFSRVLAAAITDRPAPRGKPLAVDRRIRDRLPDPSWKLFTALITRQADDPSGSLRLQVFQNWGVKRLHAFSNLNVALRLHDASEAVLPARVMEGGRIVADTSGVAFAELDQLVSLQIVPKGGRMGSGLNLPLVSYEWSAERHPPEYYEEGVPKVRAAASAYSALDAIPVSWQDLREPTRNDWIGVFPVGGGPTTRVNMSRTDGTEAGTVVLPPTRRGGEFEVRLFRNLGWESVATSPPIRIDEAAGQVSVSEATVAAGAPVRISWSGLTHPSDRDWLGLYAKGAPNDSRVDFRHTRGAREGVVEMKIPPRTAPGEYEVRLFILGGQTLHPRTAAIRVVSPPHAGR
jgi:hypothetical protein